MTEPTTEQVTRPHEARGVVLAFIGAVCWGFSATCVSWLTTRAGVDVLWLADMRMLCTGAVFTAIAVVKDRDKIARLFRDWRLVLQLLFHAMVGVLLIQVSYMYAIRYTNPGTALLLQEMGVPLILVITCVVARRSPTGVEVVALVLAVVGTVLISTQGERNTLAISPQGLAWGLLAGVSLAGYNLIPVRLLRECGSLVTNGLAMAIAAVVFTPFVRPWEASVSFGPVDLFALFGVVVIGTMVAYLVYLRGVVEAGPVKASLVGVFEPVSGIVFAALWLGTVFSPWDYLGAAAIIVMLVLVAKKA